MNDGSHDLLGMLSCVRRLLSWPRRFFKSSLFFPEKLQVHINSRRFLNFLYYDTYRGEEQPNLKCLRSQKMSLT